MIKRDIRLSQESVREFVSAANRCSSDVDVGYDRIIVDAKSIMGVYSLDLSHVLTVSYAEPDQNFEMVLNRFSVA